MDFIKQYIIQAISLAANNLRLSSEKIEVVALLRDAIQRSENLDVDIQNMKKITELSKLGIRLHEISDSLLKNKIDFLHLSDKFKEHAQSLIKEISFLLDKVTPSTFRTILDKLYPPKITEIQIPTVELKKQMPELPSEVIVIKSEAKPEAESLKEKIIFEDEKEDEIGSFHNFEVTIMRPIKKLDSFLKSLTTEKYSFEELSNFAKIMTLNSDLAEKFGTEIIANMHRIIAKTLFVLKNKELEPSKEIIEGMRACLIVIVALVKSKEVDISVYLNRAEEFGKKIQVYKIKDQ